MPPQRALRPRQVKGGLSNNTWFVFNETRFSAFIKSVSAQKLKVLTIEVNGAHRKHKILTDIDAICKQYSGFNVVMMKPWTTFQLK